MALSLAEIARLVNGELHGDGSILINGADTLRDARSGDITFIDHERMSRELAECAASAVLAPPGIHPEGKPYITVTDVPCGFATVVRQFRPARQAVETGVSPLARISPTARIGEDVTVHAGAVIGDHVEIGRGAIVHPGAVVMAGSRVGEQSVLYPNAVLYEGTVIGARCQIHAGAVLGAYGFGYQTVEGRHQLSAQLGNVVLGDDVDVGAVYHDRPRHVRGDRDRRRHEDRQPGDDRPQLPNRTPQHDLLAGRDRREHDNGRLCRDGRASRCAGSRAYRHGGDAGCQGRCDERHPRRRNLRGDPRHSGASADADPGRDHEAAGSRRSSCVSCNGWSIELEEDAADKAHQEAA